jgi:hypothetical protein
MGRNPDAEQRTGGVTDNTGADTLSDGNVGIDFDFLPESLGGQCRSLIESYHGLFGFGCLPDLLWKAGFGPFIETHHQFRQLLRKASTTRSAKKSNEGFAQIATTLLSLEILANNFAGWGSIYPRAAFAARSILKQHTPLSRTPLTESYLYSPRYLSSAAMATLAPPAEHEAAETGLRFGR